MKRVSIEPDFESWRAAASALLAAKAAPAEVQWDDGTGDRFLARSAAVEPPPEGTGVTLPKKFVAMAARVAAHRDRERWDLLYRVAFRILYENRHLLEVTVDEDVLRLSRWDAAIKRDIHKMHAFVRFRETAGRFVAWYQPDHHVVPLAAPFFVERFAGMQWSILTPDISVHWDGILTTGAGVPRAHAPSEDEIEDLWRTYYASMFNPARTNLAKMRADMPARFWREMPELRGMSRLLSTAPGRVGSMIDSQRDATSAAPFVPAGAGIEALRTAAAGCQGCELFRPATQTVFGEGPADARAVFVGEQPGDQEDRAGRPFIGPAGEVLDRALDEAGLDRRSIYLTNAVKHFAHIERGKMRIHRTPRMIEVTACRPWLDEELRAVNPDVVVCLGATATRAILGGRVQVLRDHGKFFSASGGRQVLPTIHPSAVLRAGPGVREQYYRMLVNDLRVVAGKLGA